MLIPQHVMHTRNKLADKLANEGTLPSQHTQSYSWEEWENVSLKCECEKIARKYLLSEQKTNSNVTDHRSQVERESIIPPSGMPPDDLTLRTSTIN